MDLIKIGNILISILGVSFIIFIHELGHYIFSILNGIKVEEFAIGFGKKIFSYKSSNGTLWSFRIFPLGGFVKNKGDADATSFSPDKKEKLSKDSINSKKPYQKFFIAMAGPLFNFILAFIIIFGLYFSSGRQIVKPEITSIMENSLAEKYLIKEGDVVKKINDIDISDFRDIRKAIIFNDKNILNLEILRDSKILEINIPIKKKETIGVFGNKTETQKLCIFKSIQYAIKDIKNVCSDTLIAFKMLIKGDIDKKNIGGPLSIMKATTNALSNNFYSFLMMISLISINLGIINLFPIPIVDGGQALIHILEMIIGKDLTYSKFKKVLFYIGYAMVGALMLLAVYNDITKVIF